VKQPDYRQFRTKAGELIPSSIFVTEAQAAPYLRLGQQIEREAAEQSDGWRGRVMGLFVQRARLWAVAGVAQGVTP